MKFDDALIDRAARGIAFADPCKGSLDVFSPEEQRIIRDLAIRILSSIYDWQPIESAPKDGRIVLLVDGERCYSGYWTDDLEDDGANWWIPDGDAIIGDDKFTHWLPMIPHPEVK